MSGTLHSHKSDVVRWQLSIDGKDPVVFKVILVPGCVPLIVFSRLPKLLFMAKTIILGTQLI